MSDLISRGAAIKALDAEFRCTDNSDDWNGLRTAMLIIEELPSEPSDMTIAYLKGVEDGKDAVRKTGHWIPQDFNDSDGMIATAVYYFPKCSECGHAGSFDMNYCSNCGAYMKEEENG